MSELIITSSVLILAVVVLRWALRGKISLRLQYALWAVVALRLLVPVSFGSSPVSVLNAVPEPPRSLYVQYTDDLGNAAPAPPASADPAAPAASPSPEPRPSASPGITLIDRLPAEDDLPANTTAAPLSRFLFPVWCTGAGVMLVWFLWVNLEFRRKLRASARPVDLPDCPLPVCVAEGIPSPCLFGLFRPTVYLTPACLESRSRTAHVLTHELTHWRHRDPLWSLVRCLCLSIWWFHPLVWLAASLSRRDCELACDEGALARLGEGERTAYGRTLIGLMTVSASPAHLLQTATTMVDRKRGLKERLTLIARKPKLAAAAAVAAVLIAAVAAACTFTGAEQAPSGTPDSGPEPVPETLTPLTQGELDWFNEEFFNQEPDEAMNMHNMFLLPLYETPEEIDLFTLLYNGIGYVSVGERELEQLSALDEMAAELDVVKIPAADLDGCLRDNLGLGLEETSKTGLDQFWYLPGYDAYYLSHGDTNYEFCTVVAGGRSETGLVQLDYLLGDEPRTVTLQDTDAGYLFRSNLTRPRYDTVEDALRDLPDELAEELVTLTPETPSQFLSLNEGELLRVYCSAYYSLSSNLSAPFGWVASLYRMDKGQYNAVFYDPSFETEPQTFWECFAIDGEFFYVLNAPLSAPAMNRIEDLGQSAYTRTLEWLRKAVLSCSGVYAAATVTNTDNTPISDPAALQTINGALERMAEDNFVYLDVTGEGHEPPDGAYGRLGIPYDAFAGTLQNFYAWVLAEDSGGTPRGDAVSPVEWLLTAGTDDGSVTFQFYPESAVVACTVDGEVSVLQALELSNGSPGDPASIIRRWYDNTELSLYRADITLDTSGPEWTEYDWFGSDYPHRVAEDLAGRYLEAYTRLPPGNQFHLDSATLRSVEIYDMDDLSNPTELCFFVEWILSVDDALLNGWNAGAGITYISTGPYAGQWAASSTGMVYLSGDGLWHVQSLGGGDHIASNDGTRRPDIKSCSDGLLMIFLLGVADGAYAEGAQYELGERFLARPADVLNAIAEFREREAYRWPDYEGDAADMLVRMLVAEFKVMRGPEDRVLFEAALDRYLDEHCDGMVGVVREAYENYAEP